MKILLEICLLFLILANVQTQIFLSEGKEEEKNQLEIEYLKGVLDQETVLSYPKQLSSDKKHGVIVWAPGNGSKAGDYEAIIRRLASHGFVVIGLSMTPGDGSKAIEALNFLEEKNKSPDSPLNGKLDMNTVGCSGHSMGGSECRKAIVNDKRIITAILNNSGDWEHVGMAKIPADKPVAIVYANNGMEKPHAEADYGNENVKAPSCLIMMDGADYGHGSGPWDGMAATVAWLRWHLGGEAFRKADFVGTSGKYINEAIIGHKGNWKGQCKNF
jgi:hypothetical protein